MLKEGVVVTYSWWDSLEVMMRRYRFPFINGTKSDNSVVK